MNKTIFSAETTKQEIIITRIFNAPRELVFKAFTDPIHITNWWGPGYLTTTVDKLEPESGGSWRFVQSEPNGNVHAFHGVYHDIVVPERIVDTFEYEGVPGHVLLESMTFEDNNGSTKFTNHIVFQSIEDRDGMIKAGMESGMNEGFARLDLLLQKSE